MSVGGLGYVQLHVFGLMLLDVFGDMPYQVGSSVTSKQWRDVDVVVMMSREKFYHWTGPHGIYGLPYKALCAAFSCRGEKLTGLPIDFKIQIVTDANEQHRGQRNAIGIRISKDFKVDDWPEGVDDYFPKATDVLIKDQQ